MYTIVLLERSGREFHSTGESYIHRAACTFDTGLDIDLLQKYVLIPLDIFKETMHNKPIGTELEAWLTFLSTDEPERIIGLVEHHPEFRKLYGEVYGICRSTERVMGMFSKELQEIDRNTVQYMIDEMQDELDSKNAELGKKDMELNQRNAEFAIQKQKYEEAMKRIQELEQHKE